MPAASAAHAELQDRRSEPAQFRPSVGTHQGLLLAFPQPILRAPYVHLSHVKAELLCYE